MVTRYIKDAFLHGAGDSVVGQVRKANEDNCGYRKTVNGELFVVCDGMGGHVGGATASRIAVDSILNFIAQQVYEDKRVALDSALRFANTQIMGAAAQDPSLKGMGTTACIALVDAQNIWIAHVGDSRIYLYSEKEQYLYRITKDHSLVQGLVDRGELDDREAEHHPQKNIILKALGTKPDVIPEVDQIPVRAQVGDTILICSDGLSGMLDDNQIEAILREDRSLEDKVQKLIDNANTPDKGKDNITVQLVQVLSSLDNVSAHPNFNPKWRMSKSGAVEEASSPLMKVKPTTNAKKKNKTLPIVLYSLLGVGLCLVSVGIIFFSIGKSSGEEEPQKDLIDNIMHNASDIDIIHSDKGSVEIEEAQKAAQKAADAQKEEEKKTKKQNTVKQAFDDARNAQKAAEKARDDAKSCATNAAAKTTEVITEKTIAEQAGIDVEKANNAAELARAKSAEVEAIANQAKCAMEKANSEAKTADEAAKRAENIDRSSRDSKSAKSAAKAAQKAAKEADEEYKTAMKAVENARTAVKEASEAVIKAKQAVEELEKSKNSAYILDDSSSNLNESVKESNPSESSTEHTQISNISADDVIIPIVINYPQRLKAGKEERNFSDNSFPFTCQESLELEWSSSDTDCVIPTKSDTCRGFKAGNKKGKAQLLGKKNDKTIYIVNVEVK